tara:strand:- start:192 stop:566 length:375 start_codon:yes stop_codon:yes gene_type:complete
MAFKMKGSPMQRNFGIESPVKLDQTLINAATAAARAGITDPNAQQEVNNRIMNARRQGMDAIASGVSEGLMELGSGVGEALSGDDDNGKNGKNKKKNKKDKDNKKSKDSKNKKNGWLKNLFKKK